MYPEGGETEREEVKVQYLNSCQFIKAEVNKVPCSLIFFPRISVPFPSSKLDNLPYSLDIKEQMILLFLTLFYMLYSTQKSLNYLPLFTT